MGVPFASAQQRPPKPARVGVLSGGATAPAVIGLRQGLKDLGYVEGRDLILEIRAAHGRYDVALDAARELVKGGVHILVSAGTVQTRAAKEAAGGLPVVFTQVGEPVGSGFVQSLARPGGNMTGFATLLPQTTGKRLELLRELLPRAQTVHVIFDPENPTSRAAAVVARQAAKTLRVRLRERHVKSREDVARVLREISHDTFDAILILPDSLVVNMGGQILEVSGQKRIPVIFHERSWVESGGLASYGPDFTALARQAAGYVDKILKGAKPGDLPVQQATRFEFVINFKTARALGLAIPQAILVRADEVIR